MTPLVSLVQTSTYDHTPIGTRLPPVIWTVFTALNRCHAVWRWYRRAEVYRKPENLANLVIGHVVNWIVGDMVVVRVAAQCLLVATRILECAQQQEKLFRSGRQWIDAFKGRYPAPITIQWEKLSTTGFLSPSTVYWWKSIFSSIWERISRIAFCTFNICRHAFTLSMHIMDVIDAFCWSPAAKNDAFNESFVNIGKWLSTIMDNKEELLEGLNNNKPLIESILKGTPLTFEQLQRGVNSTLEKTEIVHQGIKKISNVGGGIVVQSGKRIVNGALVVAGLSKLRPVGLCQ